MKIAQDTAVSIHYTLRDADGATLDASGSTGPLAYLHGHGNIIPGLESALEGKVVGDKFTVNVAPEQGYGVRDERLVQMVPRTRFGDSAELVAGMQFQAQSPQGPRLVTVTRVEKDLVTVDSNHPLAGKTLTFEVDVAEVRKATRVELEHGHVHGPGGHHH